MEVKLLSPECPIDLLPLVGFYNEAFSLGVVHSFLKDHHPGLSVELRERFPTVIANDVSLRDITEFFKTPSLVIRRQFEKSEDDLILSNFSKETNDTERL